MRSRLPFKLPTSRLVVVYVAIIITSISVVSITRQGPRVWAVEEVPVAFWAWRTQSPTQANVDEAVKQARAHAVFLRAGQIDYQAGTLRRIRPLNGSLPRGIKLHLVYNATRALLEHLESVDPKALAAEIARAYQDDSQQAERDGAEVGGVQLDIDVPTRLLPRYETTLNALRSNIPQGKQLSITGLPTWMESPALAGVLKRVDFWVPQFYGAEIARRSDQLVPISSVENLTRFINQAREIDRPFYAGLAAYSVALLYSASGPLITLRGDMDPAVIASDPNLELIDQRSFAGATTEWRYVYRARADGVTDGLNVHAGDVLVVQLPGTESLRVAARITRELAGEKLLGICVFRLPERDDPATLTVEQVATALTDHESFVGIDVRLKRTNDPHKLILEVKNTGTANALVGTMKVDLALPPGSFESTSSAIAEPLCESPDAGPTPGVPQACSQRRANVIRFMPRAVVAGQSFKTTLVLNREPPQSTQVNITLQTDAGQSYFNKREVSIETGVKQ